MILPAFILISAFAGLCSLREDFQEDKQVMEFLEEDLK